MATWDDNLWYGNGPKALKTCPFNAGHRVKAEKYDKHVLKCEQSFPKLHLTSRHGSSASHSSMLSMSSTIDRMTASISALNVCDTKDFDRKNCSSPDSGVDVKTNSSAENTENEELSHGDDKELVVAQSTSEDTKPSARGQAVPILPLTNSDENPVADSGAGDSDNWDNSNAQHFDIYEGFEDFEKLTDDVIQEVADSFIDTVFINRLDKPKRKLLYKKLIELKRTDESRKCKAIKELLAYEEVHPQIKDIPQEIRKPKVDIRDLFNLKKENDKVDTLKKSTIINEVPGTPGQSSHNGKSPDPKSTTVCTSKPWTIEEVTAIVKSENPSSEAVSSSSQEPSQEDEKPMPRLTTCCNSCWDSVELRAETVKRVTVYCPKCSGVKFGGYFECQDCKLYGYFANNQIEQHLSKHFQK